ncbi:Lrp/AsnC family transcriptional regulator [Pedobacter sp. UYP24]
MDQKIETNNIKILECLQINSKSSAVAIGKKINLSSAAILKKIGFLESEGFVIGYSIILDRTKLKKGLSAKIEVTLNEKSEKNREIFLNEINDYTEIIQCYVVSGEYDYLLHIAVSDMNAYNQLHSKLINTSPTKTLKTSFVIKELKSHPTIDLSHLY